MSKAKNLLRGLMPLLVLAAVYAVFKILQPDRFGSLQNMWLLVQQSLLLSIFGCGIYFLLSLGIFDLSAGINAFLSAMMGQILSQYLGLPGLFLGAILCGLAVSFVVSQFMQRLPVNPMIISVGFIMLFEAVTQLLTGPNSSLQIDKSFRVIGAFPWNGIISLTVMSVTMVIYKYTVLGVYIRAIGSKKEIAGKAGLDVAKYTTIAFMICGFCAAIYGMVNMCYSTRVAQATGMSSATAAFRPMMACMFANSFKKYLNPIIGMFIGILFLNLISNGLLANGLESSLQNIIIGFSMIFIVRASSKSRKYDIVK